jgi:hypothetical protein
MLPSYAATDPPHARMGHLIAGGSGATAAVARSETACAAVRIVTWPAQAGGGARP